MSDKRSGQILLVTVMLVSVVVTVLMATVFKANIDTQTTKLQEESQKALAAAEAGIESALQGSSGSFDTIGLTGFSGIDAANSQVTNDTATSLTFTTSLIPKDEQYVFYLSDYNNGAFSNYWSGNLEVYFKTENDTPVLELTLVKDDAVDRALIYVAGESRITAGAGTRITAGAGGTIDDIVFSNKGTFAVPANNYKVLIIRSLFAPTKLGFKSNTINLRLQGNKVISVAKTTGGIVKRIELFQSWPQVPADFFITKF